MTALIVENEDNKSAARLVDASEKHCWLYFHEIQFITRQANSKKKNIS